MISIEFPSILWVIVNVVVLYILFRVLLFNRLKAVLDARKQKVQDQFDQAAQQNEEAQKLRAQYEESLRDAREESGRIVADAKSRGEAEYNRIVAQAQTDSKDLIQKANDAIELERERARKEVQDEITGLAMAAAAKIIGGSAGASTDGQLYNEFLTKAGEKE